MYFHWGLIVISAVITTATTATASVAATTATAGSIGLRSCFVYNQGFAEEVESVKASDSLTTCRLIRHFDKTETTAALSDFVHDDFGRRNFAILFE